MNKEQILQQLEDLGFPNLVNSVVEDNPPYNDLDYYIADIEKARRETTEEEFPQEEYQEALSLIELYFNTFVLEENKTKFANENINLDRWNKLAGLLKG